MKSQQLLKKSYEGLNSFGYQRNSILNSYITLSFIRIVQNSTGIHKFGVAFEPPLEDFN